MTNKTLTSIIEENIIIKNFLDLDITISDNYVCNGNLIGEQLEEHGPYIINGWNSVKGIDYSISVSAVDDLIVLRINEEKIYESKGEWNYSDTIPFKMSSNKLLIKVGAKNTHPDKCLISNLKLKLTLKF